MVQLACFPDLLCAQVELSLAGHVINALGRCPTVLGGRIFSGTANGALLEIGDVMVLIFSPKQGCSQWISVVFVFSMWRVAMDLQLLFHDSVGMVSSIE